jgi:hypothetical protein
LRVCCARFKVHLGSPQEPFAIRESQQAFFAVATFGLLVALREAVNRAPASRRMQFLADYPAKRGFDLLGRHGLVERLIDEGLVPALPSLGLEECNDRAIEHDGNALLTQAFADRSGEFFAADIL